MTTRTDSVIEVLVSDLTYVPNPQQRRVKEAFWVRHNENPLCEPQDITCQMAIGVTGDTRLQRWWGQAGFPEWFRNQEEFRERAASLAHQALDTLQQILLDGDAPPAARVQAAKLALEIARKMPSKQQEPQFLDDQISKMDKKQLKDFLARNVHLLPQKSGTEESD